MSNEQPIISPSRLLLVIVNVIMCGVAVNRKLYGLAACWGMWTIVMTIIYAADGITKRGK